MKTETPVDRDKEEKEKQEEERRATAVKGCLITTTALLAGLFLIVVAISVIAWVNTAYGIWMAIITFCTISCMGIGIFFGFSLYIESEPRS